MKPSVDDKLAATTLKEEGAKKEINVTIGFEPTNLLSLLHIRILNGVLKEEEEVFQEIILNFNEVAAPIEGSLQFRAGMNLNCYRFEAPVFLRSIEAVSIELKIVISSLTLNPLTPKTKVL